MSRKIFVTFFFILIIILLARFLFFFSSQKVYKDGEQITFKTTIASDVKVSGNIQRFTLRPPDSSEAIYVSAQRFPTYSYGDQLLVSGRVKILPRSGDFKPLTSDGRLSGGKGRVLKRTNTIVVMYFPTIERIEKPTWLSSIIQTRKQIITIFENALSKDSSALLLGIVFGIKRPMSDSLRDAFQSTGLLHVIAASGMNITMVGGFLSGIFAYFFNRRHALILTVFGIFYYALLSGFEASIVRASIMGSIAYGAKILGRQSLSWYSLLVTGIIMLLITPQLLVDIGFQLSFLATFGLIFIPPLIKNISHIKPILAKSFIGEDFLTTLSAQIVTMPLLLLYFGTFSITSILVNTIVLWTVPLLMVIGGVCAFVGLILEPLARLLLLTAHPLLLYIQTIPKLFSRFSMLKFESIPLAFVVGYYFVLAGMLTFFYSKKKI